MKLIPSKERPPFDGVGGVDVVVGPTGGVVGTGGVGPGLFVVDVGVLVDVLVVVVVGVVLLLVVIGVVVGGSVVVGFGVVVVVFGATVVVLVDGTAVVVLDWGGSGGIMGDLFFSIYV